MRLAALINAWSDVTELLPYCIQNISPVVDKVIVLYSVTSNHGVKDDSIMELIFRNDLDCQWVNIEPTPGLAPMMNEITKRNYGIKLAKDYGYTHFISMDGDEFFKQDEFLKEKNRFNESNLNGLVHPLRVHIKSPKLWCEDHTLVPGIQRLYHNTQVGTYKHYPFNQDKDGHSHIDPTRRVNCFDRIEMSSVYMYHMSYVRKNIDLKINSSTANLRRSREVIYQELANAKPGYMSKLYHKELKECENYFNIPEFI